MARARFLRASGFAVTLFGLLAAGCRHESPVERGAREYRERQQSRIADAYLQTLRLQGATDAEMVRANRHSVLGLAIRPDKTGLLVNEPLTLRLSYENLAARMPISATTCVGFSLTEEDESTGQLTTAAIPFSCPQEDLVRNNVELSPGKLRSAMLTTAGTSLAFPHPGRYLIIATWQSYRPSEELFPVPSSYPIIESNPILLTVR